MTPEELDDDSDRRYGCAIPIALAAGMWGVLFLIAYAIDKLLG